MPTTVPYIHPEHLLAGYANGIFPMAESATSGRVAWHEPTHRGIIPLGAFRVSRNVRRLARNGPYSVHYNLRFRDVMRGCANRPETWINAIMLKSYCLLHELGYAHSVEVCRGPNLVGGLYGVALRGAFFGESMFQSEPEVHKIALLACHQRLVAGGFLLWDTQYYTPHLGNFGAIEIPQALFLEHLGMALQAEARFINQ